MRFLLLLIGLVSTVALAGITITPPSGGGGASGADLQLSNLEGTVAVPITFSPATTKNIDLGTSGRRWGETMIETLDVSDASSSNVLGAHFTTSNGDSYLDIRGKDSSRMPSGTQCLATMGINNSGPVASTNHFGFYTAENSAANANDTGKLLHETGNITNAGASGNTGDIEVRPGTNAGSGLVGKVLVVGRLLELLSGMKPVSITADPCGDTDAFPEGTQFYNDTSNYYCYCDGTNDVQMHSPATACFL